MALKVFEVLMQDRNHFVCILCPRATKNDLFIILLFLHPARPLLYSLPTHPPQSPEEDCSPPMRRMSQRSSYSPAASAAPATSDYYQPTEESQSRRQSVHEQVKPYLKPFPETKSIFFFCSGTVLKSVLM